MSNSRGQAKVVKKNLLDDIDLTTPIHKGYLFKQSLIPPKNFNKRYFALYPKVLIYYDNEATFVKDVLHGTIEHRDKAILIDHLYLTKPEKKPHGAKFCFILHAPNQHNKRHQFLFVTETKEDRRVWMAKLQELNPELLASEHQHSEHRHRHHGSTSSTTSTGSTTLEVPRQRRIRSDSGILETMEELKALSLKDTATGNGGQGTPIAEVQTVEVHAVPSDKVQSVIVQEGPSDEVQTVTVQRFSDEVQSVVVQEGPSDEEN